MKCVEIWNSDYCHSHSVLWACYWLCYIIYFGAMHRYDYVCVCVSSEGIFERIVESGAHFNCIHFKMLAIRHSIAGQFLIQNKYEHLLLRDTRIYPHFTHSMMLIVRFRRWQQTFSILFYWTHTLSLEDMIHDILVDCGRALFMFISHTEYTLREDVIDDGIATLCVHKGLKWIYGLIPFRMKDTNNTKRMRAPIPIERILIELKCDLHKRSCVRLNDLNWIENDKIYYEIWSELWNVAQPAKKIYKIYINIGRNECWWTAEIEYTRLNTNFNTLITHVLQYAQPCLSVLEECVKKKHTIIVRCDV